MREARILRVRYRGGISRGTGFRRGRGNWEIALLVAVGLLGLLPLGFMLYKMAGSNIKNWRSMLRSSAYMLGLTLLLIVPAIVLLSLDTPPAVGTVALISLGCLLTPLLIWILIALRKSRHFERSGKKTERVSGSAEPVHTAKGNEADGPPFPAYNFLPQGSAAPSVAPQEQTSQQSKPSTSV